MKPGAVPQNPLTCFATPFARAKLVRNTGGELIGLMVKFG